MSMFYEKIMSRTHPAIKMLKNKNKLTSVIGYFFILVVIAIALYFRIKAINLVPMVGDEPDDMAIIFQDLQSYRNLFTNPVVAPDQSRLPYLLSLPFWKAFGTQTVQPYITLRYLFLSFYVGFLYLSYRLALLFTGKFSAALGYVMLLLASCYLSAFSIFFLTTSDSLFLLTHVAVLYTFYSSWQNQRSSDFFPRHVTLAVMLGLCVASKLFGLFIAVSLVLFHLVYSNGLQPFSVRGLSPGRLVSVGFLFILLLVIINIAPLADAHKLIAVVMLATAYILFIGIGLFRDFVSDEKRYQTGLIWFWLSVGITSFNLLLIFSPIYLNLTNLINILNWPEQWNQGLIVADSHWWDISQIIVIKFGLVSSALLLIPLCYYLYQHRQRLPNPAVVLVVIIFVVHVIVISVVRHKVTWYPLAIFPFLYLPWVWLWNRTLKMHSKKMMALAGVIFLLIAADNLQRYYRWYPYPHFDGAQYGNEHIGWNRSALITFEVLPLLDQFFLSIKIPPDQKLTVHTNLTRVPRYNRWMIEMLTARYRETIPRISITGVQPSGETKPMMILTSPLYNPELEIRLAKGGFQRLVNLEIKDIAVLSMWVEKNSVKNLIKKKGP